MDRTKHRQLWCGRRYRRSARRRLCWLVSRRIRHIERGGRLQTSHLHRRLNDVSIAEISQGKQSKLPMIAIRFAGGGACVLLSAAALGRSAMTCDRRTIMKSARNRGARSAARSTSQNRAGNAGDTKTHDGRWVGMLRKRGEAGADNAHELSERNQPAARLDSIFLPDIRTEKATWLLMLVLLQLIRAYITPVIRVQRRRSNASSRAVSLLPR